MKTHLWLTWAAMVAVSLTGCSEDIAPEQKKDEDRKNEYTKTWIQTFGLIPADQDWCMVEAVAVNVITDGLDEGVTTKIYTSDPAEGGRLKATVTDRGSLPLDVTEGTTALYAVVFDAEGAMVARGYCEIDNGVATITPTSLSPRRMSRHVDDFITAVTFDAILVCEDMGSIGDFDFNDIVLGLTTVKDDTKTTLTITPLAAGGTYNANIYFNGEDKGEIHSLMREAGVRPSGSFYNTNSFGGAGTEINIEISGTTWAIANDWGDIRLKVKGAADEAIEISQARPGRAPQMMCLPGDFYWPTEQTSIKNAYADFQAWATGGYKGDGSNYSWLDTKADAKVVTWEITIQGERRNYFIATCKEGVTEYTYNKTKYTSGDRVYVDGVTSCKQMFYQSLNLVSIDLNGSHFDTSNVTDVTNMFGGCTSLCSLDISEFNTSKVTDLSYMFYYCTKLTELDTSTFNTSRVTNMYGMFWNCSSLTSLDVSTFTTSMVENMGLMFCYCSKLTSLDLSRFNTSKVTNMSSMFHTCSALTSLDLSGFTTSKVTSMSNMFYGCPSGMTIKCKRAFKTWCETNSSTIKLPANVNWILVD